MQAFKEHVRWGYAQLGVAKAGQTYCTEDRDLLSTLGLMSQEVASGDSLEGSSPVRK